MNIDSKRNTDNKQNKISVLKTKSLKSDDTFFYPLTYLIFSCVWWHTSAITCQIIILTCQIFMLTCQIFVLTFSYSFVVRK